jgi:hypothetical protein
VTDNLTAGYDVAVSATRLSNYLHVLRELVHLSAGHLALEPRFEVKALLGDHLYDDARAVTKLRRRLYELGREPEPPADELAAVLDRADRAGTPEYLEIAYGGLKPALIDAVRTHLANLDPLADEPSLRLLTQLLHRQERHVAELPADERHELDDLGALPAGQSERRLEVMPPLDRPERDAFVEVAEHVPSDPEDRGRATHDLMDSELSAAELTARNSHEHPDMPWDFHVDMARQTWDHVRRAEVHDRTMTTELGCHWGDHPVGFSGFREIYALDLVGRLALMNDVSDSIAHIDSGVRWGTYLLGGDEQAFRDRMR